MEYYLNLPVSKEDINSRGANRRQAGRFTKDIGQGRGRRRRFERPVGLCVQREFGSGLSQRKES